MTLAELSGSVRVEDLLEHYPQAQTFLFERGVVCVQCGEVFWGELGELVEEKGLNLETILTDLKTFLAGPGL